MMRNHKWGPIRASWLLLFAFLGLFSCSDPLRVYEKNQEIPEGKWYRNNPIEFSFEIEDTNQSYNVLYNLRCTRSYPFTNLYLNYELLDSTDRILKANQQEMFLFTGAGKPTGETGLLVNKSLGDVYDYRFLSLAHQKFPYAGTYKMRVKQYMRDPDPLGEVLAIGLRIEKPKE